MSQTSELTPFTTQEKLVLGGYATQIAAALVGVILVLLAFTDVMSWKIPALVITSLLLISFGLWAVAAGREKGPKARWISRALWVVVISHAPLLTVGLFI